MCTGTRPLFIQIRFPAVIPHSWTCKGLMVVLAKQVVPVPKRAREKGEAERKVLRCAIGRCVWNRRDAVRRARVTRAIGTEAPETFCRLIGFADKTRQTA